MHLIHTNRNGFRTDITLVGKYLTFSKIVDSKLATINKTLNENTSHQKFISIIETVTNLDNEMFLLASSNLEPEHEEL